MNEIEFITNALKDAYKFVKEQEQTKETGELLITLFKAEILVKNCSVSTISERSRLFSCPLPDVKCDKHKINDEEGKWEFCNTCKREWIR